MAHCNFNITYPVCDALFGTLQGPKGEKGNVPFSESGKG
jgi:sterol desaturase/sphingolipid hydroxylase (fatty acid hydroxylase superfamily)